MKQKKKRSAGSRTGARTRITFGHALVLLGLACLLIGLIQTARSFFPQIAPAEDRFPVTGKAAAAETKSSAERWKPRLPPESVEDRPSPSPISFLRDLLAKEKAADGSRRAYPSAEAPPLLAEGEALRFKNLSDYEIDPAAFLAAFRGSCLSDAGPQVLIIHTHTSEAYTPEGADQYEESDPYRTLDPNQSVVRVGEEVAAVLETRGIRVIHDETLYDYPRYDGAYGRAKEAIDAWLLKYPGITAVLDIHRDAVEYADGTPLRPMAEVDGEPSAQVMILCGTDSSGLYHPLWRENLAFAFTLQARMEAAFPGLARPLKISQYRYNTHETTGSLLIEIGSHGNSLQEALVAARAFAACLADVLLWDVGAADAGLPDAPAR